ncbi:hypothetical protein KPH14_010691 [Odynerus spinipes]|uniref:Uncharacterized protein n=1 Tax=Odynerus spinipes TaxID=1348599 RepID=A0AAD9RV32_9HYME|nr:hypothetical protein KPH14_010691 [Odynerus spinipes]
MKFCVLLSCIVLLTVEASAKSDNVYHKFLNSIPPEVQTKCSVEADLVADKEKILIDESTIDIKKLSCYSACALKQAGVMVNGKIENEPMEQLIEQVLAGDPVLESRKVIIKECIPEMTGDNDCDRIIVLSKCILDKVAEQMA